MSLSESKAFENVGVWVILKDGSIVGKVLAVFSPSGVVRVEVWQFGYGLVHQGRAGGYGYDKLTSALRGCVFDGHELTDHCERKEDRPETGWQGDPPTGWHYANYDSEIQDYKNIYKQAGLDYLVSHGFQVWRAV